MTDRVDMAGAGDQSPPVLVGEPAEVPCPFCAIQGVRVYPTWRRYWLMPPQLVCPRCSPNWQPPALWRRVVRCFVDWVSRGT